MRSAAVEARTQGRHRASSRTFIRYFLLAFAFIALFVGAFVIFNTLSITVAQADERVRDPPDDRRLRRQILCSVILEALVIGFIASVIGLVSRPRRSRRASTRSSRRSTSTCRRRASSSRPARSSSRCSSGIVDHPARRRSSRRSARPGCRRSRPCARATCCRSRASRRYTPVRRARRRSRLALVLLGYRCSCDEHEHRARACSPSPAACCSSSSASAMISSRLVKPLAAVVGWPAPAHRAAPSGRLARENAKRNPGRTAATAAALMIGLALVTFVAVARERHEGLQPRGDRGPGAAPTTSSPRQDGFTPFVAGRGLCCRRRRRRPRSCANVRSDLGKVGDGFDATSTGIEPRTILADRTPSTGSRRRRQRRLRNLGPNDAVVDSKFAEDHDTRGRETRSR